MVDLLHGAVQQMLRFGPAWARSSSEQLVWIAACTKTQMVYVVHSLVTTTEPGGLQTAGAALQSSYLVCNVKKKLKKSVKTGNICLQRKAGFPRTQCCFCIRHFPSVVLGNNESEQKQQWAPGQRLQLMYGFPTNTGNHCWFLVNKCCRKVYTWMYN